MKQSSPVLCACGAKSKLDLKCGLCQTSLCKPCAQFVDDDQFSFLAKIPLELSHTIYCQSCFNEEVAPELESYLQVMEKAKEIIVYKKSQSKETRLLKRLEAPLKVERCADFDETILRLAFFAAKANFNAIIDLDTKSEKVKTGSYQTTLWSGTAVPVNVQERHIVKDRSFWQNPN